MLLKGLILLCLMAIAITCSAQVIFPLKINEKGTHLVDNSNKPFLIKEISAWGLIQALSEANEDAFIDSVKAKGFNTLMVSIISFDTRFAAGPPNWQGIPPFKTQWDFSTYNTAYFDHVDRFLKMAENKGMLVLLVPCYLGYKGDGNQGWWDELLNANNSPEKSRQYGQFLGNRYKAFNNIIWEAGGDNSGTGPLYNHMDNIIQGIKQFDKQHLWTGHFESAHGSNWTSDNVLYAKYIDIDGLYDFTEGALCIDSPQYKTELRRFGNGKMIFQLDQSYEQDIPHGPDNENYQIIRRKNYEGLLSGCAGTSFSPGQKDNQCYTFTYWRPLMNTRGMQEMQYCFRLFDSLGWDEMVPDTGNNIIVKGRGKIGSADYVCAAENVHWYEYVAYLPKGEGITVDLKKMGGDIIDAYWFNPLNGEKSVVGSYKKKGVMVFASPSKVDWVLLFKGKWHME